MFLWACQERLEDDNEVNFWANLSCFDFDFWLSDETKKRKEGVYQGNKAYELMTQTFSWPGDKTQPVAAAGCFASNLMCVYISIFLNIATSTGAAPSLLQRSRHRNINIKTIDATLCKILLCQQLRRQCINTEDNRVRATVVTASESSLPTSEMIECQDDAKRMEDILLSCGSAEHNVTTLRHFKEWQEISEAWVAILQMEDGKQDSCL